MSLFHAHKGEGVEKPEPVTSFDVLGADGTVRRYARDDFDEIVETKDPDEVQRQVAHGWAILAQREVESGGRSPSGGDLIVGIEGLRVGGLLGHSRVETVTWYTLGFIKDGAPGESVA